MNRPLGRAAPRRQTKTEVKPTTNIMAGESRFSLRGFMRNYLLRHAQVLFFSLGRFWQTPFSSLLTAAVLGIALALPAGLHVLLNNAQAVSGGWDGAAQISLFLKADVTPKSAQQLERALRARPDIAEVTLISRDAALEEFKRFSGFGDALKALNENPLPSLLTIRPDSMNASPAATSRLVSELRRDPNVEIAQLDMEWVKRLYAIMAIAQRGILVVAVLLSLAVLLIIGNTIRLEIENRREEIIITKLIGATDAFIRRPFLYGGLWYGLSGGFLAWLLVTLSLALLTDPVNRLSGLYHSTFQLQGLDINSSLALLGVGGALGLAGSWIAVARHLHTIEPT